MVRQFIGLPLLAHVSLVKGFNYDLLKPTTGKTRTNARRKLLKPKNHLNRRGDELANLNERTIRADF